jgi:hypothetical protein
MDRFCLHWISMYFPWLFSEAWELKQGATWAIKNRLLWVFWWGAWALLPPPLFFNSRSMCETLTKGIILTWIVPRGFCFTGDCFFFCHPGARRKNQNLWLITRFGSVVFFSPLAVGDFSLAASMTSAATFLL